MVWQGRETGVFSDWTTCKALIDGYPKARYKSFQCLREAEAAFKAGFSPALAGAPQKPEVPKPQTTQRIAGALSVDAACSGNPGKMEYRAVWVDSGEQWFHRGPWLLGTNNIGEFLAIVHALAQFDKLNMPPQTIYTDSKTAMSWVKNRKAKTLLVRNATTNELWDLVERAEVWLKTHHHPHQIVKWPTEVWGEIPADFGRKG